MKATLQLNVTLDAGREAECAKYLREQLKPPAWAILAALAAEILHEHENRTAGTVIVVAGPSNAEKVLADLQKSAPRGLG